MGIPFGEPTNVIAEFDRKSITHVVVPRVNITRPGERNLIEPGRHATGTVPDGVRELIARSPPLRLSPGNGT